MSGRDVRDAILSTALLGVDPRYDDAVALLAALRCEELDLAGVTAVAGNTPVENATRNSPATPELVNASVPVATSCAAAGLTA